MNFKTAATIQKRKILKRQLQREERHFLMELPKGLLVIALIMIFGQVLLSNLVGVKGAELVELDNEKAKLAHEKMLYENRLAELSSLSKVEEKCKEELGMKETNSYIYLKDQSLAGIY